MDYISGASGKSASELMKSLFGTGVKFSEKNVADMSPSSGTDGTALAATFPKNEDSSTSGKVAAFEYSQKSLPVGKYPSRSGKSYYIDELFTGELGSVISRLESFQQNISEIRSNLINAAEIMKAPTALGGGSGTSGSTDANICASLLTKHMFYTCS